MLRFLFIAALLVLMAKADGQSRPDPPYGWKRVGCVRLQGNRQTEFSVGYKLTTQNDCLKQCGSSDDGSSLAAIGGKCWCSNPNVDDLTVLDGGDFNCEAFCYPDSPHTGTCGALNDGVQYYDLYKTNDAKVTVKPGFPVPPNETPTCHSFGCSTATAKATCGGCMILLNSADLAAASASTIPTTAVPATTIDTTTIPTAVTATGSSSQTSAPCAASDCAVPTGSGSKKYYPITVSIAVILIVASFLA